MLWISDLWLNRIGVQSAVQEIGPCRLLGSSWLSEEFERIRRGERGENILRILKPARKTLISPFANVAVLFRDTELSRFPVGIGAFSR